MKIASNVLKETGKSVSAETVRRVLRNNGYNGRVARKKPLISEINRQKRLQFVKDYENKDEEFWKNVIFSDESKFNLFGSDGRQMVWRKPNTALNKANLCPTIKHGGGSLMVWGCYSYHGVGNLVFIDGIMDKMGYLKILKENLKQSADKMGIGDTFYLYQDHDPKHDAMIVREWLLYNCRRMVKTPPQSPDANPIENLWSELERRIRTHQISNQRDLKQALIEEWEKITPEYIQKTASSMQKRLKAIKENNGFPTKY